MKKGMGHNHFLIHRVPDLPPHACTAKSGLSERILIDSVQAAMDSTESVRRSLRSSSILPILRTGPSRLNLGGAGNFVISVKIGNYECSYLSHHWKCRD